MNRPDARRMALLFRRFNTTRTGGNGLTSMNDSVMSLVREELAGIPASSPSVVFFVDVCCDLSVEDSTVSLRLGETVDN